MRNPGRPISRRNALVAGASLLGGLGLSGVARAAEPGSAGRRRPKLTPRQEAGQRVIFSYPGPTPPATLFDLVRAGEVGGVIFFGENIPDLAQVAAVVADLTAANEESPVDAPLLLMTDQEGGIVRRIKPGEPTLTEKQIGASADPTGAAHDAGIGAAQSLAGVGMNTNLAPVLDVYREAGNFDDQFGRSYSSDPEVCSACGAAFVTAQQGLGIVATAKHFPGLGAATRAQNTDLGTVTLTQPAGELHSVDEYPFVAAIKAGVDMVMTSWAVYPALDPVYPAGFSPAIVQGELRDRLGFRGVTITDALEAGSLASFGDTGARTVLAARAGMDVLLCSARDVTQGSAAVDALAAAIEDHRLNPGHSRQALRRVLDLRTRLGRPS
ncbi:MAG TPA: glycoside hydrolase family 3 N-terminal domain-containing protein [Jatrophihabitans sp.]|nr:glycoside hydrolase family 3 N-terminal domain-containing protein [Jatrophihabitans sp.]